MSENHKREIDKDGIIEMLSGDRENLQKRVSELQAEVAELRRLLEYEGVISTMVH